MQRQLSNVSVHSYQDHQPTRRYGPQYEPGGHAAAVQQRTNMTQREDALKFEQGRIKALQEERLHIQKKTFTKWVNSFLQKARMEVEDLFADLADGRRLLKLLEIISGERLPRPNSGRMRVHKIENVNKSLSFLHTKVYAPTSSHSDDEVEEFYDLLNKAYDENRGAWNLVIGNFNAKVGTKQELDNDTVIGPHGLGDRNERGTRLIQFAFGQSLNIGNSFFFKRPQRRWTWMSPDTQTKNEIDYILTLNKHIMKDVGTINQIKFSSDHRPLRAKIHLNQKIERAILFKNKIRRHDKHTLFTNVDNFNIEIRNYYSSLPIDVELNDVKKQHHNLQNSIRFASKKIKQPIRKNERLSIETLKLIDERENVKPNIGNYRVLDKQVKRSIRKDIRNYNVYLIQVALEKNSSLRTAKLGISTGKTWINSLKDEKGTKKHSRDDIMSICTKFYKSLYSDSNKPNNDIKYNTPHCDNVPPITDQEVHMTLNSMKYLKSPGRDGVTTEALKIRKPILLPHLTNLFNTILFTGEFPTDMCHSDIILLHKKGDRCDIGNYRPISLISHIYKVFIKIIERRIANTLGSHQPVEQAGFRPRFSTTDHLQTLNQITEKFSEFSKPLYLHC